MNSPQSLAPRALASLALLTLLAGCAGGTRREQEEVQRPALHGPVFLNEGGPMLVLPADQISWWRGNAAAKRPTDYERALELVGTVATIEVAGATAVVVGNEELLGELQWISDNEARILVGWLYNEKNSVDSLLFAIPQLTGWQPLADDFDGRGLALMHAATDGAELTTQRASLDDGVKLLSSDPDAQVAVSGDAIIARAPSRTFTSSHRVEWRIYEAPKQARAILVRWTPNPIVVPK